MIGVSPPSRVTYWFRQHDANWNGNGTVELNTQGFTHWVAEECWSESESAIPVSAAKGHV